MAIRKTKTTRKPKSSRARKRRLRQQQQNSLHFEALEPKQLLAVAIVGNTLDVANAPDVSSISALIADDGGDGISLREAITAANNTSGEDLIAFDQTTFDTSQTISLDSQLPTITDSLDILGPVSAPLTIDAGNGIDNNFATGDGFRIFEVNDGNSNNDIAVGFSALTLTGGDGSHAPSTSGGAIFNMENLTLTGSLIVNNNARFGGGLSNFGTATIIGRYVRWESGQPKWRRS